MSKIEDEKFLVSCLEMIEKWMKIAPELSYDDLIKPEEILSAVPSKSEQEKLLLRKAEYFAKLAKKVKSPTRSNLLEKCFGLLLDSDFRTKRAHKLVARKKWLAHLRIEELKELCRKAEAEAEEIARLADEYGIVGGSSLFRDNRYLDDPESCLDRGRLQKKKEVIKKIIAEMEKPLDRSVIPDGAELINVHQVARMLNCAESMVYERNRKKLIPAPSWKHGSLLWNRREIFNWMKRGCPSRKDWEDFKQKNRNQAYIEEK